MVSVRVLMRFLVVVIVMSEKGLRMRVAMMMARKIQRSGDALLRVVMVLVANPVSVFVCCGM